MLGNPVLAGVVSLALSIYKSKVMQVFICFLVLWQF